VVPVSYREKIRVGRSEIIFFEHFFHGFFNNWCDNRRHFGSSPQPPGENRVARSIALNDVVTHDARLFTHDARLSTHDTRPKLKLEFVAPMRHN
jgi:hypothetical protein